MVDQNRTKKKIINRLKSLEELDGVAVTLSERDQGTVYVRHKKEHALEFRFHWSSDHFIGHFIDANEQESQAVVSLKTPMDAIHFVSAYDTLDRIRARQRKG